MACWFKRFYVFLFIYKEVIGQRQYIFVDETKNPNDAELYCQNTYNTSLATVTTSAENQYITSHCIPHDPNDNVAGCLIGLTDQHNERLKNKTEWQWFDGSTNAHFYNWAPGEPNQWKGNQEDCVAIWLQFSDYTAGVWNDRPCDGYGQHFFCNAPTLSPTSTPTYTPTIQPTISPTTIHPTVSPSMQPTSNPTTISPTINPTKSPTEITAFPTILPTMSPTQIPTRNPTYKPTVSPTNNLLEMEVTDENVYNGQQTYAPSTLGIERNDMYGRYDMVLIGLIFGGFVGLCCCIVFAIVIWCLLEKQTDSKYTMRQTSKQITPTDSNEGITIEMVTNEKGNVKMNKNRNSKQYMKVNNNLELPKRTSFELHLTNTNVATDVLMSDIINDMHKESIVEFDTSDDEGVIDDDMNLTTPQ